MSEVTVDELESALQAGAPLIDVRETNEYVAGHVAGGTLAWTSSGRPIVDGDQPA